MFLLMTIHRKLSKRDGLPPLPQLSVQWKGNGMDTTSINVLLMHRVYSGLATLFEIPTLVLCLTDHKYVSGLSDVVFVL